jgi:hypothetical protein
MIPKLNYKWRVYLHGLVAAILNAVGNAGVVVLVDPVQFNLFQGGFLKLLTVTAAAMLFGFLTYIKTHPLPDPDKDTDAGIVADKAIAVMENARSGSGTGTGTGDGGTPRIV